MTLLNADQVLQVIDARSRELREKFGVSRIGIFGSVARDDAHPGSDVDIVVRLDKPSFDCYMDLKFFLEDLVLNPVDLVLEETLRPRVRTEVEKEARYAPGLSPVPG